MEILTMAAVLCAYVVKGMCGFANTLVFSTIMSFSTTNINISPLDLIVGYPSNILIAWKEKKSVSAKICVPLSILVILGSIPGAIFLKNGNTQLIKTVFGFAVVLIGVEMLLREYQKRKQKSSRPVLFIIGIVSGLLCGMYGIGAFLAGLLIGMLAAKYTDDRIVKRIIIVMLMLSGISLILSNLGVF